LKKFTEQIVAYSEIDYKLPAYGDL